jgi:RAD51-like protein 1
MCLQLAVCAQVGSEGTVIYVDTESRFSAHRMVEIASGRFPARFSDAESQAKLTRNVAVFSPGTSAELVALIGSLESLIIERSAKLVIIDSMAALMRADFSRERLVERQAVLGEQAARLKRLAEAFRIPFVVTNQVQGGATAQPGQQQHGETSIAAALGTKWAHDVNLRLMLEMGDAGRCLTIAKSAAAPALSFPYRVTSSGLQLDGAPFEAAFVSVDAGGGVAGGMTSEAGDDLRTAFFSG